MAAAAAGDRLGLCSVTLRALSAADVVAAASRAGLARIEWGADVHAPANDAAQLAAVRGLTEEAGLTVSSYGSYWRAGAQPLEDAAAAIAAAGALGTDRVRIWAGDVGLADADADTWARTVAATHQAAAVAADHGCSLAFEFHGGTLTETPASTLELLERVDRPNVSTYWQPPQDVADEEAVEGLLRLLDVVSAVHVFSWWPGSERLLLAERSTLWLAVLKTLNERSEPLDLLMEFVPNDDVALLAPEAQTVREWMTRTT